MSGAFTLLLLVFALAIPLALWAAIENETSNPTVVDREEAERLAKERGGRKPQSRQLGSRSDPSADADRRNSIEERRGTDEWGSQRMPDSEDADDWGTRRD